MQYKKMGRPTDNPKTVQLTLRLAPDEAALIRYCSEKLGIPRVAAITRAVKLLKSEIEKDTI